MREKIPEFLEAKAKTKKSWYDLGAVLDVAPRYYRQTACGIVMGRREASLETLLKMGAVIGLSDIDVFKIWQNHRNTKHS